MNKKLKKNQLENHNNITLDKDTQYLHTFDLGVAASLFTGGFELISLDKTNPRKVQFIFRRKVGIEMVVDNYWSDHFEVKARTFFDNLKMLKNRIYSE